MKATTTALVVSVLALVVAFFSLGVNLAPHLNNHIPHREQQEDVSPQLVPEKRTWRTVAQEFERVRGLPAGILEGTCDWETRGEFNRFVAVSHAGAVGLCQVLPTTAAWLLGFTPEHPRWIQVVGVMEVALLDPSVNLMFASEYMALCYNGNTEKALYCYNRGHNANFTGPNRYTKSVGVIVADINRRRQTERSI